MIDHISTRAVRTAHRQDLSDAYCEPIALTSAYVFSSAREAASRFDGTERGNVYSRFTNPTVQAFEKRFAAIQGAEAGVSFSSGMAAIAAIAHAWLVAGKNVVCSRDVFGTTLTVFRSYFGKFGVQLRAVSLTSLDEWREAIDTNTAFVFFETPSNPTLRVADVRAICQLAHAQGAQVVVDNTFLTPIFQNPFELGADVVVHSAGKYADGQGRCVAGIALGSDCLMSELRTVLRVLGSTLGAMEAWLLLKSLEMLELRVGAIGRSAMQLAQWLASHPKVKRVLYTGLPDHPQHKLALRQQSGHGGVLSFEIHGGREEAWKLIDALKLISIATNIGDTRTMITHPASTTHCKLSAADRLTAGIGDGLLRLSVGLENTDDLMADIDAALKLSACHLEEYETGAL